MKTPKRKRAVAADQLGRGGQVESLAAAPTIVFASHCTVKDVSALQAALIPVVDAAAPVCLDISNIERVDTATLQLLYVFVRDRAARNLGVVWQGSSRALFDAAQLLDMQAQLSVPVVTGAGVVTGAIE